MLTMIYFMSSYNFFQTLLMQEILWKLIHCWLVIVKLCNGDDRENTVILGDNDMIYF